MNSMNIFKALEWCYNNPFKEVVVVGNKWLRIYHDNFHHNFILKCVSEHSISECEFVFLRTYLTSEYEVFIEKVPLRDLFDRWLNEEPVFCEIDGDECQLCKDSLVIISSVRGFPYISPTLAAEPIWYTKDVT